MTNILDLNRTNVCGVIILTRDLVTRLILLPNQLLPLRSLKQAHTADRDIFNTSDTHSITASDLKSDDN